jgi:hypothetical protein
LLDEYPLSPTILPGNRLGLPLPARLMEPPSINCSNTVHSCCCPPVSAKHTGLPLPSHRTCILVEKPPRLLPKASFSGSPRILWIGSNRVESKRPNKLSLERWWSCGSPCGLLRAPAGSCGLLRHSGEHVRRCRLPNGLSTRPHQACLLDAVAQPVSRPRCLLCANGTSVNGTSVMELSLVSHSAQASPPREHLS